MSRYTTELRYICEEAYGLIESKGNNDVDTIIANVTNKVFNFEYPIFDEAYRKVLEIKILRHFYTREIGEETVGLWKLRLNSKMNEIMPYYNKLYESELIEFNPLYNYNITTDHKKDVDSGEVSHATSEGTIDNTNWNKYNDTPQGSVGNLDNDTYLTNARKVTEHGTTGGKVDNNVDANSTEDYLEHKVGYAGSNPNKMLKEYRDNFLNIDLMIIDELDVLFMQLW